jgi:hypothetical protein
MRRGGGRRPAPNSVHHAAGNSAKASGS